MLATRSGGIARAGKSWRNQSRGVDLLAGGVPCPPFSIAGKQLGHDDERDLFPEALRLIAESKPVVVQLENVRISFRPERMPDVPVKIYLK
jgi:DNA (cytosine-5)-methyltransferase 1